MFIKTIKINNYRAIKEEILNCDYLTALIGRNGSGKSSFLHAMNSFYDIAAAVTVEDFFERKTELPIEIKVTFGDLKDEEKEEFKTYIKDERLIVTKKITHENEKIIQKYYAASMQIPKFAEIRAISGKKERISAWNDLIDSNELSGLTKKVKKADDIDVFMAEYESTHTDLLQPIEREEQFFGPRSIGGGKLDKFTKFVLIPAVREASDEASGKKGAVYQLLDMIVLRKINARKDIQEFKSEIEKKVNELYSSENLTELPALGASISETLGKFAPGSQLNLKWDEVKPPEVQLPSARATLIEDNFEGEINRKGHGLQRALVVSLLQYLALMSSQIINNENKNIDNATQESIPVTKSPVVADLILAFEEPELYLHPARCRYLSDLLLQLTSTSKDNSRERNQIIYATHSPYFVDLLRFDKLRVVRKIFPCGTVPSSTIKSFTLDQASKELSRVCDADPNCITCDSFRARAMSIINIIVNEGFFADATVVVEGQTEVGILWKLQDVMKKNWAQLGISVVPAGSKNNIDRPTIIFRGLGIPTYFIFDGDFKHKGNPKKEAETIKRNHQCLKLANASVLDFPDTEVHETWAVFKDDIEQIMKEDLGDDIFMKIRDQVASELGYDEPSRLLKNIEGANRFIECVYEGGKRIGQLEKIVEAVTNLCNHRG